MYTFMTNTELKIYMEKVISSRNWEEYLLLQEEADIRGI